MANGQGLFKRLPGKAKRYAPISGAAPPGVKLGADNAISTRQFNKLADDVRGYAKQAQPKKLLNRNNHKRSLILSRKRDFQAQAKARGLSVSINQVGNNADYKQIEALFAVRTKPTKKHPLGRPNETATKRALVLLGRRNGLPWNVPPGDSPKAYYRDRITGVWHKKQ